MKPETLLQFSVALLFACIAYAQNPVQDPEEDVLPKNTDRIDGWTLCLCSKTGRGFRKATLAALESGMRTVQSGRQADAQDGLGRDAIRRNAIRAAKKLFGECTGRDGHEACVNADFSLRSTGKNSFCFYDKVTKKNLYVRDDRIVTVGKCNARSDTTSTASKLTEGCVAVEHLQGYVLQHRKHLLRLVLCSRGFCATPNHGIIVDGTMTSMKHLCSHGGWECTKQVKLVNNLKLSANRRAQVADNIIVTPYDVRFPKIAIWAVQMLEDIWNLLMLSVAVGAFAAASGILASKIQCHTGGRKKQ